MVSNKKTTGKAGSILKGLGVGTTVALAITILFAVGMTQLILGEKVSESAMGYGAMIILPLASGISAMIAVWIIRRKRLQMCLFAGLLYFLVLGGINLIFFGGQFQGVGTTLIMILLGVVAVALLGLKGERGNRKKRKIYRPR